MSSTAACSRAPEQGSTLRVAVALLWVLHYGHRAERLTAACDGDTDQAGRVFGVLAAATLADRARRIAADERELRAADVVTSSAARASFRARDNGGAVPGPGKH